MNVIITGASQGIGAGIATFLGREGFRVGLLARSEDLLAQVQHTVEESGGVCYSTPCDLRDRDATDASIRTLIEQLGGIDSLINNAGVMACPLARTASGCEMQFGTNHIGHFLLTCLLVPALRAGAPARVVCLSSGGHKYSPVVFDDINF